MNMTKKQRFHKTAKNWLIKGFHLWSYFRSDDSERLYCPIF